MGDVEYIKLTAFISHQFPCQIFQTGKPGNYSNSTGGKKNNHQLIGDSNVTTVPVLTVNTLVAVLSELPGFAPLLMSIANLLTLRRKGEIYNAISMEVVF